MARTFDGNDWIDFGDTTILDGASLISGHAWVKLSNVSADHYVFEKLVNFDDGLTLFFDDIGPNRTDVWSIFMVSGATSTRVEGAASSAVAGSWQSVGFTFVGNNANGLRLYIDGVEDANSPATTQTIDATFLNNASPLVMGRHESTTDRGMQGDIDECALWVGATLTAEEFKALASGVPASRMRPDSLVWHPLMLGESPEPDYRGGLTGTLNGSPFTVTDGPPISPPFGYDIDWPPVVVAAAPGARPQGPLGHPLHGPLAGPIAA